ncbi:portal protein [Sphingomonas sp. KC8]|uniref:portal protein n=1 Tax=Sphingomonas sp. KC8 TaxID=1030157 RepID=UPI000248A42F|nr:portal protein [Sphingomonas sp. KC8]ARS27620.1 hypothetical protein KC8_09980 [Sphingomonas sp. KC8]
MNIPVSGSVDVDAILQRQSRMEADRANFETDWLDTARHMLPRQADFLGANATPGAKRTHRQYDGHAADSLKKCVAVVEGFTMPRGAIYQVLQPDDDELLKVHRVKLWFEEKTKLLFKLRYAPRSGFTNQSHESITSLIAFGNQGLWVDRARNGGLFYRTEHIGQLYFDEDLEGRIDVVHKKFKWSARKAYQKWGDAAPECVQKARRDRRPDAEHEYLHVLQPRHDVDPRRLDARGMPVASAYVSIADKYLIEEGGFRKMPLIASRYEKSGLEKYGRGLGQAALPWARAANTLMRSIMRAEQMRAEPPLGMPDDGVLSRMQLKPNGLTTGAVNSRGELLVKALATAGETGGAMALLEMCHNNEDAIFLVDLFEIGREAKSHVSAAAIMERSGEKGMLLAPTMGRQEVEFFAPLVDREVDCMADMGALDDMPPELIEAGGRFQIRYDTPLTRAMRSEEASGFFRTVEGVAPIAQVDNSVLDVFDFESVVRGLADVNGVPAGWMVSRETLAAKRQERATAAQSQQLLEAAPVAGKVALDLAQAGAMANAA